MKMMSYICRQEEVKEKRDWILSLGLKPFRQTTLMDIESSIPQSLIMITFAVPDKETETYLKISFPPGTFRDCSS